MTCHSEKAENWLSSEFGATSHRTVALFWKSLNFINTQWRVYNQSARRWREVNHAIDPAVGCHYSPQGLQLLP